jgi:hypothetical protein
MSNTKVRLLIGSSAAAVGIALIYGARIRSRNRSLLARTRKQAAMLADQARRQAVKLGEAAAGGLVEAVDASKAVYHRVAG